MKRSDIIKIMVEEADSEFILTLEQIADRMLSACEEAGMLPPLRKAKPSDYANIGFDQKFLDDHEFEVYGWDDE
jgi:hypothetical protein